MPSHDQQYVGSAVEKLNFLDSPLRPALAYRLESIPQSSKTANSPTSSTTVTRPLPEDPSREVHEDDATGLEILYDLFFAACLNLFSTNQELTTVTGLAGYCGFFGLLWTTWFMTGMYDVRFLTDSIFERCGRGVHLGVLVGFVVISPNFNTEDQEAVVFKAFTIILMVSRLSLAAEYGGVLYLLRNYHGLRRPVVWLVLVNFLAAMIYLGVSFKFQGEHNEHNSNVFSAWYILAGFEIFAALYLAYHYKFLSFQGTYIMKRMGLLTCIFFGEGIISTCSSITKVIKVENHAEVWTSQTIGTVTACVSLVYISYMVYMDWISKLQLPSWRQMTWVVLHFPLHLAMLLFLEGISQFIIFWKLYEKSQEALNKLIDLFDASDVSKVKETLRRYVEGFIEKFPPQHAYIYKSLQDSLDAIDALNLTALEARLGNETSAQISQDKDYNIFTNQIGQIYLSLDNTLYGKYGIDFSAEVARSENVTDQDGLEEFQMVINARNYSRFRIVFQYSFLASGCFLAVANILSIISRTKKWTWSAGIYHATIFLLALGLGLVSLVTQNDEVLTSYWATPWILPTFLFTYMLVLTLNHVAGNLAARRDKKKAARMAGTDVEDKPGDDRGQACSKEPQFALVAMNTRPSYPHALHEDVLPLNQPHLLDMANSADPPRAPSSSAPEEGSRTPA